MLQYIHLPILFLMILQPSTFSKETPCTNIHGGLTQILGKQIIGRSLNHSLESSFVLGYHFVEVNQGKRGFVPLWTNFLIHQTENEICFSLNFKGDSFDYEWIISCPNNTIEMGLCYFVKMLSFPVLTNNIWFAQINPF